MDGEKKKLDRIQRTLLQGLESLQRSGVTHLVRRALPVADDPSSSQGAQAAGVAARSKKAAAKATLAPRQLPLTASPSPVASDSTSSLEDPIAALAAIQRDVAACRRCEHLACTRTQTVFGVGNPRTRLCFFGEAPGADEDRKGEPFVGRAGQLLTDIIRKGMGLQRSDVYIMNVLKCRPPENRTPTDEEIANCREYFERQFEVLQPEFICCLGATAARALLETKQSLGRLRGQWFNYRGSRVMVTYHPSYLLRNPAAKKDTWEDIQMLMREMGLPEMNRREPR